MHTSKRVTLALLLVCLAGPAFATDGTGGGPLTDVDFDASTVTIRDQVFDVTRTSELRDAEDRPITLLQLEHELGEWVYYKALGRGVLDVLQLAPGDQSTEE